MNVDYLLLPLLQQMHMERIQLYVILTKPQTASVRSHGLKTRDDYCSALLL